MGILQSIGVGCHALLQGVLPNPGIEPGSPALQVDSLPSEPPGKPIISNSMFYISNYLPDAFVQRQFQSVILKTIVPDFPDGTGDQNQPAHAGDTGLIPDPGRFRVAPHHNY